jgi:hypothetical protein
MYSDQSLSEYNLKDKNELIVNAVPITMIAIDKCFFTENNFGKYKNANGITNTRKIYNPSIRIE